MHLSIQTIESKVGFNCILKYWNGQQEILISRNSQQEIPIKYLWEDLTRRFHQHWKYFVATKEFKITTHEEKFKTYLELSQDLPPPSP